MSVREWMVKQRQGHSESVNGQTLLRETKERTL